MSLGFQRLRSPVYQKGIHRNLHDRHAGIFPQATSFVLKLSRPMYLWQAVLVKHQNCLTSLSFADGLCSCSC
jgi:hypothetical protein